MRVLEIGLTGHWKVLEEIHTGSKDLTEIKPIAFFAEVIEILMKADGMFIRFSGQGRPINTTNILAFSEIELDKVRIEGFTIIKE